MDDKVSTFRNVALIGHGGSGATSLAEAMLFDGGATNRLGRVDDGTALTDYEPEELKRRTSISTSFHHLNWKRHRINLIDTPGDENFHSDTKMSLQAADGVIVVLDAVDSIKAQSEKVWSYADELKLPRVLFVNKLDRERANFDTVLKDVRDIFNVKVAPLALPIGSEAGFKGVVDLLRMKALIFAPDGSGKFKEEAVPADMAEACEAARDELIEYAAEGDDALLEKYLEGEKLTDAEISQGLRSGTLKGTVLPLACGSGARNSGVQLLLDMVTNLLPSPLEGHTPQAVDAKSGQPKDFGKRDPDAPFSALVFKTVSDPYAGRLSIFVVESGKVSSDSTVYNANKEARERFGQIFIIEGKAQAPVSEATVGDIIAVAKLKETATGDTLCDEKAPVRYEAVQPLPAVISFAVEAKVRGEEDKVFAGISKLLEEDPTLRLHRDPQTGQMLLSGMGQVHIDATIDKLRRKFGVDVTLKQPRVPYKETIKGRARVQGKFKRQTGGRGQYGDTWLEIEAMPRGGGFEFLDKIVGGAIPRQYIPAVEKGIIEAMSEGAVAGYPVVDIRVALVDGTFHEVDSSEMAFKIAGSMGFKKGVLESNPILLEPVMKVTVGVPDDFMGDVIGDLNSRRGRVLGMESRGRAQHIVAHAPMSEMLSYQPDLTSMTGGRGSFTMEFDHYEELPAHLAEKVIAASKAEEK
jgi:elongation factor G